MIIWTRGKKIVVGFILIATVVVVALMFLNYLPNPFIPYNTPEPEEINDMEVIKLSNTEGETLLELVVSEDFPLDTEDLFSLNTVFYGITNATSTEIMSWYENELKNQGWEPMYQDNFANDTDNYKIRGFMKGVMGQMLATWGGTMVSDNTEYDVILMTTSAPLTTYYSLFKQLG